MAYTTIDNPSEHFNTIKWSGNGNSTRSLTGVGFQPDWTWHKVRSHASSHMLYDSTRGVGKRLHSDQNVAEATETNSGTITSFDSDGFSVDTGSSNNFYTNESAKTYVAWNWKANGGTTSTNTDGSENSTVQVNSTAGFSIVKRTGTGSAGATYGHGLGVEPEVIINKGLNSNEWYSYFKAMGAGTHWIALESNGARVDDANMWNDTDATSSVFTVGNSGGSNGSGVEYIAYCFHSVKGYSKFGSYTGNGANDGPFVYLGFKPAWLLIKISSGHNESWHIWDNKRVVAGNPNQAALSPNTTGADTESSTPYNIDFLSNGFKIREDHDITNGSGDSYIYMAFAEHPFVSSKGVPVTAI